MVAMRFAATCLAWALLTTTASAGVVSTLVDLGGSDSEGSFGEDSNTVVSVVIDGDPDIQVAGFEWILSFEAFSPSWGAEARIDITSPDGTTFTFSGALAGWDEAPGIYADGDETDAFAGESYAGTWTFRFYEEFNDGVSPDGTYIEAVFEIEGIPAPGALAFFGLAAVTRRRRRSA